MNMKMKLSLTKLTIRLLILMILFVMIYMLSLVLYSSRYWPDIYNYINPNITIKRIPTLSELELNVLEVDFTTEYYTTIEEDTSTVEGFDFDIDEFTNIQGELPKTRKNARIENFQNDYNELPTRSVVVDYTFLDDSIVDDNIWKKIVKDLVDESKLVPKNLDDVEMVNKKNGAKLLKMINNYIGNTSNISDIFPWIATIFIKNDSAKSQFQYTCDGALLDKNMVLTAARCLMVDNITVNPDDVVIFLGKKSLHNIGEDEKIVRISQVKIHNNFSNDGGMISNDLGLLVMEEPVPFTESIQPASLGGEGPVEISATTAWDLTGELTPLFFEDRNENCKGQIGEDGTICATYGYEVPLCPSRGGLYVTRRDSQWYLHGIHSGLPEPVCFTKEVHYTPLEDQLDRIVDSMVDFVL